MVGADREIRECGWFQANGFRVWALRGVDLEESLGLGVGHPVLGVSVSGAGQYSTGSGIRLGGSVMQ